MRRLIATVLAAMALAACAQKTTPEPTSTGAGTATGTAAAAACDPAAMATIEPETLTIGTGNPAYTPWFDGGNTDGTDWEINNPETGKGFESAVAYAVAGEMGYDADRVRWVAVPFDATYAPGPKDFDFAMQQISYDEQRAEAVDFSDSYYDENQALITYKDSVIDGAGSVMELAGAHLGAPIGTTSLDLINEVVQPSEEAAVYDNLHGAVQDLKNHQVDGIVVDLPTAFYIRDVQVPDAVIVGQFDPDANAEYFGMTFEKGSPLVACVNQALASLKSSGELAAIQEQWLSDKTEVPVLTEPA